METVTPTGYIPAQRALPAGSLDIHGLDDEQRALLGFLSRFDKETTRISYQHDIDAFRQFCRQSRIPTLLAVTRIDVQLYVRWLQRNGLAPATISRRIGTLRGFYKNACIDDLITKDPTLGVITPKVDPTKQRKTYLTPLEFVALLKESRKDPRNHAMVIALGELGMRVSEMCSLDVENVRHELGAVYVTFTQKGGDIARINLTLLASQVFARYIDTRTSGPLFLARDHPVRWSPCDVRRVLNTLVRRAGISHNISPHSLRRTKATTMQAMGIPVTDVQQSLRHKDLRTTMNSYALAQAAVADSARSRLAAFYAGLDG